MMNAPENPIASILAFTDGAIPLGTKPGTDGYVLTYDSGTGTIRGEAAAGGGVTSVNGETGVVVLDATDVGAMPFSDNLDDLSAVTPGATGLALLTATDAAAGRTALALGAAAVLATPIPVASGGTGLTALTDATGAPRVQVATVTGAAALRRHTSMVRRTWTGLGTNPGLTGGPGTFVISTSSVGAVVVDGRRCGRLTNGSIGNSSWYCDANNQIATLDMDREFSVYVHLSSVAGLNVRFGPIASTSIVTGSANATVSCLQLRGHTVTANWQFETRDGSTSNTVDTGVAFAAGYYHLLLWRRGGTVGWSVRYNASAWPTDATTPTVGSTTSNPPTGAAGIQIGGNLTANSSHLISVYGLCDVEYIP